MNDTMRMPTNHHSQLSLRTLFVGFLMLLSCSEVIKTTTAFCSSTSTRPSSSWRSATFLTTSTSRHRWGPNTPFASSSSHQPNHHLSSKSSSHSSIVLFAPDHGTPSNDVKNVTPSPSSSWRNAVAMTMAAMSLVLLTTLGHPTLAVADSRVVGEIKGSGLIFKDTLVVESFDDPKVQGVTLYVSNFQRPLAERLTKDFLSDPSYASVACAKTGPIAIADNINRGKGGEEVFEESRSLLFKTLRVQRIYDADKKTVIYASFNTRWNKDDDANKSRFKSSICAVNLE